MFYTLIVFLSQVRVCFQFQEKDFTLRTLDVHCEQCDELEEDVSNYVENSKEYGVNFRSILMELEYFDVCSGALLQDVMHDLLEGVLQYEGNFLLQHCITDCQYFTLAHLNSVIDSIELGYMEADDRPTPITSQVLRSNRNLGQKGSFWFTNMHTLHSWSLWTGLHFKAAQSALLGRLLPVMIGERVPEDDENWENFLLLLEILDFLMAPEINDDEVAHLDSLILQHHTQFPELYPDASVIPNIHYMVHMPRLIRQ